MSSTRLLIIRFLVALTVWCVSASSHAAEDKRELVKLPPMMQEHMLANMRDHLAALDEILGALGDGNTNDSVAIAEKRLGMSSLSHHGADAFAAFMPEPMQAMGTQLHHAASQFVVAAQNAELNPGRESQHAVYKALKAITESCNACHQAYRIR
ncbi:MAG: hypothetical protein COV67_14345 [Nitrospinae bacterium CG11_big_fil_rev_8_21_14_0_20_56_8]|nr:MAG: hypothetical protein COV67_14345 [Nitrospinae bacterium CG11_big_fil_rev_8_21_14_0_20_56_8]